MLTTAHDGGRAQLDRRGILDVKYRRRAVKQYDTVVERTDAASGRAAVPTEFAQ